MSDAQLSRREARTETLRRPSIDDGGAMWRLVEATGALDLNSPYAYLLVCSDFSDTSVVAEADGLLVGFVAGYRPPPRPEALFVWQVGVHPDAQGRGLGRRLLDGVLTQPGCTGVTHLEATVTPGNAASRRLFGSFAAAHGAATDERERFPASSFPDGTHEAELGLRIGPLADL